MRAFNEATIMPSNALWSPAGTDTRVFRKTQFRKRVSAAITAYTLHGAFHMLCTETGPGDV